MEPSRATVLRRVLAWLIPAAACGAGLDAALILLKASKAPYPDPALPLFLLLLAACSSLTWLTSPAWLAGAVCAGSAFVMSAAASVNTGHEALPFFAANGILAIVCAVRARKANARLRQLDRTIEDLEEQRQIKEQTLAAASKTEETLKRKHARYVQLQAIAERLSSLTALETIADLAVESAYSLIGKSDACMFFLLDMDKQLLSLFASKRQTGLSSIRTKHGDQFDRYVLRTHRPLLVNDVKRDFRFSVGLEPDRPIGSVIACPLLMGQSAEGLLRLDSQRSGAYTQDDLRFLDILMDLVATAVTNARLFARTQQLALTDGLTALALRRPFMDQLGREISRSARSGEPMAICIADVDNFKRFNDTYGHTAGDLILRAVAEVLRSCTPEGSMAARFGGEEFALLLPRMGIEAAAKIADGFRQGVEHGVRQAPGAYGTVTVSLGVAAFPQDGSADLELIRSADQRLYEAKKRGRNRVCSA